MIIDNDLTREREREKNARLDMSSVFLTWSIRDKHYLFSNSNRKRKKKYSNN